MTEYRDRIVDEIIKIAEPVLADNELELVEVQFRQESRGWVLRIIIYREGGISVDDCVYVSREVSHVLDVEDLIPQKYTLEVSSPGLDRPLQTERDFLRNKGKKIKMTVGAKGSHMAVEGIIEDVSEDEVFLRLDDAVISYALEDVQKAQLVIEF